MVAPMAAGSLLLATRNWQLTADSWQLSGQSSDQDTSDGSTLDNGQHQADACLESILSMNYISYTTIFWRV